MNVPRRGVVYFLTFEGMLGKKNQGGVQRCTHEYIGIFEKMGYSVDYGMVPLEIGRARNILRQCGVSPYNVVSKEAVLKVIAADEKFKACDVIAVNHTDLDPLAEGIAKIKRDKQVLVLCSHGNKSTDYGVLADYPKEITRWWMKVGYGPRLGRLLQVERRHRRWYDVVLNLSKMDAMLDEWLGARRTYVVPRTVEESFVEWLPIQGRVGFVGTLDHPPTLAALVEIGKGLADAGDMKGLPKIRLIGAPGETYKKYLRKYGIYDYLGRLSENELRKEIATWSLALHPLFVNPMGASMKLATLISYGIPILTTTGGLRGYTYAEDKLPQANTVGEYIKKMRQILQSELLVKELKTAVEEIGKRAPTTTTVAMELNRVLATVGVD